MRKELQSSLSRHVFVAVVALLAEACPLWLQAGTPVLGGSAVLEQATRATLSANGTDAATFTSSSASAVLDWSKFNIGTGQSLSFNGNGTTFFNLVSGAAGKSQIDGMIGGSGSVWVINPSGIAFGAGAQVNVGGLFAAAAGNISNAEALRNGTVMTPEFSSFGGSVEVAGSSFTADQVALMGKTVSVDGGTFNTASLNAGTGDRIVVDNVGGGKITVSALDFTDGENGLEADALIATGDVHLEGEHIVVGDLTAKGSVEMFSAKGITVEQDKTVKVTDDGSYVYMVSAIPDGNEGNIVIDGDVIAEGAGGGVEMDSAYGAGASGDLIVRGSVKAVAEGEGRSGFLTLVSGTGYGASGNLVVLGDVETDASLLAIAGYGAGYGGDGNLMFNGDLVAEKGISLYSMKGSIYGATAGTVDAGASALNAQAGGGSIWFEGPIRSGPANLQAYQGVVSADNYANQMSGEVTAGGTSVKLSNWNDLKLGDVTATAGNVVANTYFGDIKVSEGASVKALVENGKVSLVTGMQGGISIAGSVEAAEVSAVAGSFNDSSGDIDVTGNVHAGAKVFLLTQNGDVNVANGASVWASDAEANVQIVSGYAEGGTGNVKIDGDVVAKRPSGMEPGNGQVEIASGMGKGGTGDVTINGQALADGIVKIFGGFGVESSGGANLNGTIQAGSGVFVTANGSDLRIGKHGAVFQGRQDENSTDGFSYFITGVRDGSVGGNVIIDGTVVAKGEFLCLPGYGEGARGELDINGSVSGYTLEFKTKSGDIHLGGNGRLDVYGEGGFAGLFTGYLEGGQGDVRIDGTMTAHGKDGWIFIGTGMGARAQGDIEMNGSVSALGQGGRVWLNAGYGEASSGDVLISGDLSASQLAAVRTGNGGVVLSNGGSIQVSGEGGKAEVVSATQRGAHGDMDLSGAILVKGRDGAAVVVAGYGRDTSADVRMDGRVVASGQGGSATVIAGYGAGASGGLSVAGSVRGASAVTLRTGDGDMDIRGDIATSGSGQAALWSGGGIRFAGGTVHAGVAADVVAVGDVSQRGAEISPSGGFASAEILDAAVSAATVNFSVDGSVGKAPSGYVAVDGKVYGVIGGDALIAAAGGANLQGGERGPAPTVGDIATASASVSSRTVSLGDGTELTLAGFDVASLQVEGLSKDFSSLGDTSSLIVGGDLSVYTAGKVEANGLLVSGGDMTVSAKSFGDLSYLQAGGVLTINTVGRASGPVLAYFESVNGVAPRINNQPNAAVVFVDGRLAGGNIQTMNTLGNTEAFPVQTPELKSEQGVFGNPVFVHGDLDVSEPIGIGVIDFLLVDRAKMSYGSDIPDDMDMEVSINGLSPLYSYWFGLMALAR